MRVNMRVNRFEKFLIGTLVGVVALSLVSVASGHNGQVHLSGNFLAAASQANQCAMGNPTASPEFIPAGVDGGTRLPVYIVDWTETVTSGLAQARCQEARWELFNTISEEIEGLPEHWRAELDSVRGDMAGINSWLGLILGRVYYGITVGPQTGDGYSVSGFYNETVEGLSKRESQLIGMGWLSREAINKIGLN